MKASLAARKRPASPAAAPLRWMGMGGFVGAVACNTVLGIEDAELGCSDSPCPDAGGIRTENDSLENDGAGGGGPSDAGRADAAGLPPFPASGGSERVPDPTIVPGSGGSSTTGAGDGQDGDDDSGNGSNSGGSNSGGGGSNSGGSNSGGGGSNSGGGSSAGSGGSSGPPSACQGRAPGEAFCEGSIRISCGQNGAVAGSVACATSELCQASQGASCATCLPGEVRCNAEIRMVCNATGTGYDTERCASAALCGGTGCGIPACASTDAICRGSRLERCNADLTAVEAVECGSPLLCNESAGRCNTCVPNAARCEDSGTAAVCDSSGSTETFIECRSLLESCRNGACVLLGVDL